jgi:hypothetical protein
LDEVVEGEEAPYSGTLAMTLEVDSDHVESGLREPVQELLLEQRMGHGSGQEDYGRSARFSAPHGQGYGRSGSLDQNLLIHFGPLNLIQ